MIAAVNSRANGHRARPSISGTSTGNINPALGATVGPTTIVSPVSGHARRDSRGWKKVSNGNIAIDTNNTSTIPVPSPSPLAREPSPTLPSLPSHPTLDALISSSLTDLSHDTAVAS